MRAELLLYIIKRRVYLSSEVGTVCITEWADGRKTCYLLTKGELTNG